MNEDQATSSHHSPHKGKTGIKRIYRAFFYSIDGLVSAFRNESAFRQELLLAVILMPIALLLPLTGTQKALLCASVMLVLVVELLNSAVEATVDRISVHEHELAKRAKDTGSAAVFVSICTCVLVWALVLHDAFAP